MNSVAQKLGFIGADASSERLFELLEKVSQTPYPVMILGETGVGKEVCAQTIHSLSSRVDKPFIALNCAALPDTLAESELFGHEKGAFTGAVQTRLGAFERANGGTLFLDELGELSLAIQAKLLRAIEAKEIRRVGGNDVKRLNVKLVAATHRNLEEEVAAGRFREDLYYRLVVCQAKILPLRQRLNDIAPLCAHFLKQISIEVGAPRILSAGALHKLLGYHWPGNARELRSVLQSAATVSPGVEIGPESISLRPIAVCPEQKIEKRSLRLVSRDLFVSELERNQWNRRETARTLGIARSTVKEKIKRYGLRDPFQNKE
jgi:DNA-binding NtrC family response regulator